MEITPEVSKRIKKNTKILKNIRMKGEKPTVCFLKLKRDEKLAEFHEIIADWFVDLPEGMDFCEAYEERKFPENRLLAVIIPGNCKRELGIDQDIFFPENFGQISSQSYFCIGLSKEEVFLTMKKRFQQRIENIDRKVESMKKSKENLLSCLSVLDKEFR